jgi:hypothetical protein
MSARARTFGVIGYRHKMQRTAQLHNLTGSDGQLFTFSKAIGIFNTQRLT